MLEKRDVDLSTGWISIPQTRKTGVKVEIPMLAGLRAHIAEKFEEDPESPYVYPELAELYQASPGQISDEVKRFFAEIGIRDATKSVDGYMRRQSVKDVHSFRHTFVYLAACHGIPFPIVQGIVGHLNPEMTKHYMDHAGREAKMQYLRQLPAYITGEPSTRPRELTRERVLRMIDRLAPANLERNKARIRALLQQQ